MPKVAPSAENVDPNGILGPPIPRADPYGLGRMTVDHRLNLSVQDPCVIDRAKIRNVNIRPGLAMLR